MAPRSDMAKPTSRGSMPRPPLKKMGGCCLVASPTGVLRKIAHRLEKVPRCPAMTKCDNNVQTTLEVQMRRKGSFFLRLGGFGMAGLDSLVAERGVAGSSAPTAA